MSTVLITLGVATYVVVFSILSIVVYQGALLWLERKFKRKGDKDDS